MTATLVGRSKLAEAAGRPEFWDKVNLLGDCWEWTATRSEWGYGRLRYGGLDYLAHRCSFEYAGGHLPPGLWVLHKCDNPPCVNPAHLYAGTPKNNTADMFARGRSGLRGAEGERNRAAKLTTADVVAIRNRAAAGESPGELAIAFNVNRTSVNNIIRGATWANAPGPINHEDRRGRWQRKAS